VKVRWVFKNGYTFDMECSEISSNEGIKGNLHNKAYSINGIKSGFPYLWDRDELMVIHRIDDDATSVDKNEVQDEDSKPVHECNLVYTGNLPKEDGSAT